MERRHCVNNPNRFIISAAVISYKKRQRQTITTLVKNVYYVNFGVKIDDQYKSWVSHIICYICVQVSRNWQKIRKKYSSLWIPLKPKNNSDDCYFCLCNKFSIPIFTLQFDQILMDQIQRYLPLQKRQKTSLRQTKRYQFTT